MNGIDNVNLTLDTNALIGILQGREEVIRLVEGHIFYISFVVELEVQSYPKASVEELKKIQKFLDGCVIIDVGNEIKENAVAFRKKYGLKLPDAIIAATSYYLDAPLVSSDKTFNKVEEIALIRFEIK